DVRTRVRIDPRFVFATGWSNGGKMALRVGCELADRIAAISVIDSGLGKQCAPVRPVPLLLFHGTADNVHPYSGGHGTVLESQVDQVGGAQTAEVWAGLNHCAVPPVETDTVGAATCVTYMNCSDNATVKFCTIAGMGHQWPGHTVRFPYFLG